jgi:hypothetical protein
MNRTYFKILLLTLKELKNEFDLTRGSMISCQRFNDNKKSIYKKNEEWKEDLKKRWLEGEQQPRTVSSWKNVWLRRKWVVHSWSIRYCLTKKLFWMVSSSRERAYIWISGTYLMNRLKKTLKKLNDFSFWIEDDCWGRDRER